MIEVIVRHVFETGAPPAPRRITLEGVRDDVLALISTGTPEDVAALAAFLSGVSHALTESAAPQPTEKQED